jgi:aminobenzoyl-glutamate utilization protein A
VDLPALVALRRDLHRHAEPGFLEFRTATRVEEELRELPVAVRTGVEAMDLGRVAAPPSEAELARWSAAAVAAGADADQVAYFRANGTALVAELKGSRPGPVWGYRADLDALPFAESTHPGHVPAHLGFRSDTGAMHACGHDAHVAVAIGLLHRLADRDFPGVLRVLFQPAEEGVRGAGTMIAAGVLDDIDRMIAVHVLGQEPVGTLVGSTTGAMATRKLRVRFRGVASHASVAPEEGRNALAAAATATLGVLGLPRFATADTRVNVGTLHAGDNVNVVPAFAEMTCEARAASDEVLEDLFERVTTVVTGAAVSHRVEHEMLVTGEACTLLPDDALIEDVLAASQSVEGISVRRPTGFVAGSDDVHLMMRHVQRRGGTAAYLNLGAASPAPHHNPAFDLDERVMVHAVDVVENLVRASGGTR